MALIIESLERGRFKNLFQLETQEFTEHVKRAFDNIFAERFEGNDSISKADFLLVVDQKIEDDGWAA